MAKGLKGLRKNRRLRFHCSLLFLIWSLLPHYGFLVHQHPDGTHPHFHQSISKTEIALANTIFSTLDGSRPDNSPIDSTSSSSSSLANNSSANNTSHNNSSANSPSEKSFQDPNKINFKHAHNWADPNLETLAFDLFWDPAPQFCDYDHDNYYTAPSLRKILLLLPRGPPIFQSA